MDHSFPTRLQLEMAYERIKRFVKPTPLLTNDRLNAFFGAEIWLKCEQFQPIGAFKLRGASNFALQMTDEERAKGLVTHSSGNHAQAVAYVAHHLGCKAYIVMPENSNKVKIENARRWGAEIILCEPTVESRHATADEVVERTGGRLVPPYDHEWIIQGQASCAMEIIREKNDLDYLMAPLGGGGLLSGTALAAKYFGSGMKTIGSEPAQASDGYTGFKQGKRQKKVQANTIADGLRTTVGEANFPIIKELVDEIWLADEEEIVKWMYRIWSWTKLIIEPSCAVPFAAMESRKEELKGKKIAVIITGGNVDFNQLPEPPSF